MNLIGLLFAAMIVVFVAFSAMKTYFRGPDPKASVELKAAAPEYQMQTSTYTGVLDDVRSRIKTSAQQEADRARQAGQLR